MSYTIRRPGTPVPPGIDDDVRRSGTPAPGQKPFRPDPVLPGQDLPVWVHSIDRQGAGFVVKFQTNGGSASIPFVVTGDGRLAFDVPLDWPNKDRWWAMLGWAVTEKWPAGALGPMPFAPVRQPEIRIAPATPRASNPRDLLAQPRMQRIVPELETCHRRVAAHGPNPADWRQARADAADVLAAIEERLDELDAERRQAIVKAVASDLPRIDADRATLTGWRQIFATLEADLADRLPAHERQHAEKVAALVAAIEQLRPACAANDAAVRASLQPMQDLAAVAVEAARLSQERSALRSRASALGLDAAALLRELEPTYRLSRQRAGMRGGQLADLLQLPGLVPIEESSLPPAWVHLPPG